MGESAMFSCKDITKDFSGMRALDKVNMAIKPGEIVGLVGENGAGKSTLLKIIMGLEQQTSGEMFMNGDPYAPLSTREANQNGVGMVYQEQSLITNLTVSQNIFLGFEKRFAKLGMLVDWCKMNKEAKQSMEELGITYINPEKKVNEFNFATRQMVEITKVFKSVRMSKSDHYLILLDEPTSLLNNEEIDLLFNEVYKLKEEGHSVIFVSHRLDEVLKLTDRIYVFKDGKCVSDNITSEVNEKALYKLMVGRSIAEEYYQINKQSEPGEEVVLEVENLAMKGYFRDVSFKLHKGESLGICGVVGSGKEEVCSTIIGDSQASSGTIKLFGKVKRNINSPAKALKNGIVSVPKERRTDGIIGIRSVDENIAISSLRKIQKWGYLSPKKIREVGNTWAERLSIKCSSIESQVQSLSGGNAQKVVFARALQTSCKVLILNHPTRGVDVGAKEEIYSLIRDINSQGVAVIILGDTLDECIALSNTVLVMKDGLVTQCVAAPKDHKPRQVDIIQYMM